MDISSTNLDRLSMYSGNTYRPQRNWGKVIFSQASVILLTGGGVCLSACWDTTPLPEQTPPEQIPPRADIPWNQAPPPPGPGRHPPGSRYPPPPHRSRWEIRSTCGWYASYWNAILLFMKRCDTYSQKIICFVLVNIIHEY